MKKNVNIISGTFGICAAVLLFAAACDKGFDASSPGGGSGQGGSMARFTISGDYLYTVDNSSLNVLSVADPANPMYVNDMAIGTGIETISTMDTLLFIGSQTGMHIYDIRYPEFPDYLSVTTHFRSCDPVVAYDTLAFVTLNSSSGQWCGSSGDVLQIYDISNLRFPRLIDEVSLSSPYGLAVDGKERIVFVCDDGIKAYDISNPMNIRGMFSAGSLPEVGRIRAYDCIAMGDNHLLVIGSGGLYQLGYDREKFTFISKIDLRT